jgi:hypothetical protein
MSLELNLDREAQSMAQTIIDEAGANDVPLRNALAVLEEQGAYAAALYLYAKQKQVIANKLLDLAEQATGGAWNNGSPQQRLTNLTTYVTKDIHLLLLVKQMWEQTLIYAIYACSAK